MLHNIQKTNKKIKWGKVFPILVNVTEAFLLISKDGITGDMAKQKATEKFKELVTDKLSPAELKFLSKRGVNTAQDLYNKITQPAKESKIADKSNWLVETVNGITSNEIVEGVVKNGVSALAKGLIGNWIK